MIPKTDRRGTCDHCARGDTRVKAVSVTPRAAHVADVGSLALCSQCIKDRGRTWRLRWREVAA